MFYFLSKTIDFLLMPFSISWILLLYAVVTKKPKRKRNALLGSFVILFVISNTVIINKAFNWWEYKPLNIREVKNHDVGILLTGGLIDIASVNYDHPGLGLHADRFLQTYLLYKAGKIKKIIITGTSLDYLIQHQKGEANMTANLLVQWGVKPEDIILEQQARNTRENALFTSKILKQQFPGGKYILITSAFHMRRAAACFQKAGVSFDTFAADFYGSANPKKMKEYLIPDPEVLGSSQLLFKEWVGMIVYKIMGYC